MSDPVSWSTRSKPNLSLEPANHCARSSSGVTSPFNMEAILSACPALYAEWQRRPFVLMADDRGVIAEPLSHYMQPRADFW